MSVSKYKTHNGSQRIAEKSLGTRTVMNTDFGRIASVTREQWGKRTEWVVAVVCNGIADYSETFTTRRAVMDAYEAL